MKRTTVWAWLSLVCLLAHGQEPGVLRVNPRDGLQCVWIPAGTFQMGCVPGDNECSERTKPRHLVKISEGFWMGQTEVTVAAYKRFVDDTGGTMPPPPDFHAGWQKEDHPIVNVTIQQAADYCEWAGGRLPTEAEWEYAARGAQDGLKYPWGNTLSHEDANYGKDEPWGGLALGADRWEYTAPVGSFRPNGYGLYDMAGNVSEWVTDWLHEKYYSYSPMTDPQGPPTGTRRVVRGGAWFGYPGSLRVSARIEVGPNYRGPGVGVRCVLPVLVAAENERTTTVEALLAAGANVNAANNDGRTALMRAALNGQTEMASALLAAGANVNAANNLGETALMHAALGGHTEMVRALLAAGANVNAADMLGRTALMWAALYGQTEMASALLAAGANVNAADNDGRTALMGPALEGHTETVRALLAAGANVNAADMLGRTALMWAAMRGRTEEVSAFLAAGAKVNARTRDGATALSLAKKSGRREVIKLLKKAGAKE